MPVSKERVLLYFQIAENLLYMELGVALEKPKQEICKTIIDYIDQNKID